MLVKCKNCGKDFELFISEFCCLDCSKDYYLKPEWSWEVIEIKYSCRHCKFKWEGYSDTFFLVLEHEKLHKPNNESPNSRDESNWKLQ